MIVKATLNICKISIHTTDKPSILIDYDLMVNGLSTGMRDRNSRSLPVPEDAVEHIEALKKIIEMQLNQISESEESQ